MAICVELEFELESNQYVVAFKTQVAGGEISVETGFVRDEITIADIN